MNVVIRALPLVGGALVVSLLVACGSDRGLPPPTSDPSTTVSTSDDPTTGPTTRPLTLVFPTRTTSTPVPLSTTTTRTPTVQPSAGAERFLGRTVNDSAFASYLAVNGCFAALGNWNCRATSTEFVLGTAGRVTTVIFKAPGVTTSAGYGGSLPGGIRFADSRAALVSKLGKPVTGTAAPGGFLKWQQGDVAIFVNFFPQAPLRIRDVRITQAL